MPPPGWARTAAVERPTKDDPMRLRAVPTWHDRSFANIRISHPRGARRKPMNRAPWMKTVAIVLVALWLLTGVAWADPSGAANVPQILNVVTGKSASLDQQTRTFLTTDAIAAAATYYDPNAACAGVAPVLIQLLFFNLEGQLLVTREDAISTPIAIGSKYRIL